MSQLEYGYSTESNIRTCKCSRCENQIQNPPKSKRAETIICKNCSHFEKYNESLFATQQRKLREKQAKYKAKQKDKPVTAKKRIVQISEEQAIFNEQLRKVKLEIVNWAVDNGQYYCQGTGKTPFILDCSHIISVKQRKDLALKSDNIQLLSREAHQIWESFDLSKMITLNCFVDNMEYIYKNDDELFQKLYHKLLDYYEKVKYPSVLKLIKKIENF